MHHDLTLLVEILLASAICDAENVAVAFVIAYGVQKYDVIVAARQQHRRVVIAHKR